MLRGKQVIYCVFIYIFFFLNNAIADPWYTGPLLAPSGHTIPNGRSDFEVYEFLSNITGNYTTDHGVIKTPNNESLFANLIYSHGITNDMDVQYVLPYIYNRSLEASAAHVGDTAVVLGYQALEQKHSLLKADLRITLQEIIPTGRYDRLHSVNNGTDATGLGSYQTGIGFNFQHVLPLNSLNWLRTRVSLEYVYAAPVRVQGLSVYSGNAFTRGQVNPGNLSAFDWAEELNLTQNWVAVMEIFGSKRGASDFIGVPGFDRQGILNTIGYGVGKQLSLAPAIEYNFTENVGIIMGSWFTIRGQDSPQFVSAVIALNTFW